MSFEVQLVPILDDNYVFLIKNLLTKDVVVVDVGVGVPVLSEIKRQGLRLVGVLITHQHSDHIDGIADLTTSFECPVYAPIYHQNEIPYNCDWLKGEETLSLLGVSWQVFHWPAHTKGHLLYYSSQLKSLFCGDLVFGLGVGRLFEGSYEDLSHMLENVKKLPQDTQIYCTHEYTETNLRFCEFLLKEKPQLYSKIQKKDLEHYKGRLINKRKSGQASVPLLLADELRCNPFFLAQDLQQLTELRLLRNRFI